MVFNWLLIKRFIFYLLFLKSDKQLWVFSGLLGMVILLNIVLIWQLPILEKKVHQEMDFLPWLQEADDDFLRLGITYVNRGLHAPPISTQVDQQLKMSPWDQYQTHTKSIPNGLVEIKFDRVAFDDFVQGLIQLWKKYRTEVMVANAKRIEPSTDVEITVILKNPMV